jgi:hypothetical protein
MASKSDIKKRLDNSAKELDGAFEITLTAKTEGLDDNAAKAQAREERKTVRGIKELPEIGSKVKTNDIFAGTAYAGFTGVVTHHDRIDGLGMTARVAFDEKVWKNRRHYAVRPGFITVTAKPEPKPARKTKADKPVETPAETVAA